MENTIENDVECPCCHRMSQSRGRIPDGISFAGRILDHPLPGGFLFACSHCHFNFRWPRLPTDASDQLYIEAKNMHWQYSWEQRKDWILAKKQLNNSAPHLDKTILDIGCFDGAFLQFLGSDWQRFGIEINPAAVQRAQQAGIKIIAGDLANLAQVERRFSYVIGTDIIEHVSNPLWFLNQMARLTEKNGLILISTGNTEAWSWKLAGSRYWYCVIPEHISFINLEWCQDAARSIGLKIKHIEYFSHTPDVKAKTQMVQTLSNLAYIYAPRVISSLRLKGWGQTDVQQNPTLIDLPPSWMSARDQFLVTFEKR